jgi:hypothetical protein
MGLVCGVMTNQLQRVLFLTSLLSGLLTPPVWAQVDQGIRNREEGVAIRKETYKFSSLSSALGHSTQSSNLIAQSSPAQITGIQLKPTSAGLEVLLETTAGASTLVRSYQLGDQLVAEISNAQLALPEDRTFRQDNPTAGIASISVTPLDVNRIQILATDIATAPTVASLVAASFQSGRAGRYRFWQCRLSQRDTEAETRCHHRRSL